MTPQWRALLEAWRHRDFRYAGNRSRPTAAGMEAARRYRAREVAELIRDEDDRQEALSILREWVP